MKTQYAICERCGMRYNDHRFERDRRRCADGCAFKWKDRTTTTDPTGQGQSDAEWLRGEAAFSGSFGQLRTQQALNALADVTEALEGYERWEAKMLLDDQAWGMAALPRLTQELYDGLMELQQQRNAALGAPGARAVTEPLTRAER